MKINKILAAGIAATLAVTSLSAVVSAEEVTKTFSMESTVGIITLALKGYEGEDLGRLYYLTDAQFSGSEADGLDPIKLVTVPVTEDDEAAVAAAHAAYVAAINNFNDFVKAKDQKWAANGITFTEAGAATYPITWWEDDEPATIKLWVADEEKGVAVIPADAEAEETTWGDIKTAIEEAVAGYDELKENFLVTLPWTSDGNWTGNGDHPWADYMDILFYDDAGNLFIDKNADGTIKTTGLIKLVVKGVKGTRTSSSKDYEYDLVNQGDGRYRLYIYEDTAPTKGFLPEQFLEITQISVNVNYKDTFRVYDESIYEKWGTSEWGFWFTDACTREGKAPKNPGGDSLLDLVYDSLLGGPKHEGVGHWMGFESKSTKQMYSFLEKTENDKDDNSIITRWEVKPISKTGCWESKTLRIDALGGYTVDYNQTYNEINAEKWGTAPNMFGGLASQAADFFNKQTNGKIIFKFAEKAASSSSWVNGGIPSTEVGLKTALSGELMALFINYDHSTGSLQSDMGVVDSDNLTITFDISNALDDMGGLTKGNIHEIYYGLMGGINYHDDDYMSAHAACTDAEIAGLILLGDHTEEDTFWYSTSCGKAHAIGYMVQEVIFSYDDAADVSGNVDEPEDDADDYDDEPEIDEDDDEPEIDEPDDDEDDFDDDFDDEPEIEDDDDEPEPEIDEPDDEDDADDGNNGTQIIDIDTGDDDDANPGTGAALAVIPALIAAAGIAVSKKRK